jgi:hypothetical protein
MPPRPLLAFLAIAAALAAPRAARADAPPADDLTAYAVVVGSNPGGPGQAELRFAEDDARRVAEVLRDVGGYRPGDVELVVRPDPAAVLAAIDRVAARAAADRAAGRRSLVFFYYSGHARATALNLGDGELPLAGLRERLLALPSALTVVVLDACQSGAFSRVKGAAPAADFSFNSRARLDATGVAVMASSSASELSQESDLLGSSYFTHHLLVGLRGAGDGNRDGRVSLDEAYRYAYHRTLVATAATAVGRQHVSLEVDLKGQGEVALTYPERASAHLVLAPALAGDVIVERQPAAAVVAELHKVAGQPLRLAVAPGAYRVMIRRGDHLVRCPVTVGDGSGATVDGALGCDRVPLVTASGKGLAGPRWYVLMTAGIGQETDDAFTRRLRDFEYDGDRAAAHAVVSALHRVHPMVMVGGELGLAASSEWRRDTDDETMTFRWWTGTLGAAARGEYRRPGATLVPFAQASAGLSLARSRFDDDQDMTTRDTFLGWYLAASAGLAWTPVTHWGLTLQGRWSHVPVLDNLIGDTHDAGGLSVLAGFHVEL